jgi:thymidylate synthase (FAD)
MEVKLLAHTHLALKFYEEMVCDSQIEEIATDGQLVALTAIRTCYSHNKPSEIVELEKEKYFGTDATDGEGGTDADRLIRHIVKSGHTSTLEHLTFTFAIEGVSRSLLAQLTRHRHFSFSVQSQRYVKLESDSKSGGFDYEIPPMIARSELASQAFHALMQMTQQGYDELRENGVSAEDARFVLPNATKCNLVLTGNLRSFLEFYAKRSTKQAQWEIRKLAELIKEEIINVEHWTESFFGGDKDE